MLDWGLGLAAVLIPVQILFGHLAGDIVHDTSRPNSPPSRRAGTTSSPRAKCWSAGPTSGRRRNLFALSIPRLGSFIATGTWNSKEVGLDSFPAAGPSAGRVPFWGFRIMVGMGLAILGISWLGCCCAGSDGSMTSAGSSG